MYYIVRSNKLLLPTIFFKERKKKDIFVFLNMNAPNGVDGQYSIFIFYHITNVYMCTIPLLPFML